VDDLEVRRSIDVRGGERVLERVDEDVRPDDPPVGQARIAQDPVEHHTGHAHTTLVRRYRQPPGHAEARVDRREGVSGGGHEVLALPALANLAIDHQIGCARAKRRPVLERQIQALGGSAIAARLRVIETRRLCQDTGRDEGTQQGPPRDLGRPRSRNGGEREQSLVRGGFDDLVAVELEGAAGRGPEADRDRHEEAGDPTVLSERETSFAFHGLLNVGVASPIATPQWSRSSLFRSS